MFFIARNLADVAKVFDANAAHARKDANAAKAHARLRKEGEAYAYEQAARLLRELKWGADVEALGERAPYAIPRDK
jgi:hypothetical protein